MSVPSAEPIAETLIDVVAASAPDPSVKLMKSEALPGSPPFAATIVIILLLIFIGWLFRFFNAVQQLEFIRIT